MGGGEGKITPHGKVVNIESIVLRVLSISLRNVRRSHQPVHLRLLYPKSYGYRVDSTPVFKQRRNSARTSIAYLTTARDHFRRVTGEHITDHF